MKLAREGARPPIELRFFFPFLFCTLPDQWSLFVFTFSISRHGQSTVDSSMEDMKHSTIQIVTKQCQASTNSILAIRLGLLK